jgi:ubiquinone/menaquinone biosynthesis C-methylase UbiE
MNYGHVPDDIQTIAANFDQRAARYSKSDWHRDYAEQFVALAPLQPGQRVLDAGAGTGFATLAIARRVGPAGRVVAVDVSSGMLAELHAQIEEDSLTHVETRLGDATDLPMFAAASFDLVLCSSALLYMSAPDALREWHRLLAPGGIVGFSTMCAGSPVAGRVFRDCARDFGLTVDDPSAALGSEANSRDALETAGFGEVRIAAGETWLSRADLDRAWESNLRSAAHARARELPRSDQESLRARYEAALQRALAEDERKLTRVAVLFAFGRKCT